MPTTLRALACWHLHRYLDVWVVSLLVLEQRNEDADALKKTRAPSRTPDAILDLWGLSPRVHPNQRVIAPPGMSYNSGAPAAEGRHAEPHTHILLISV